MKKLFTFAFLILFGIGLNAQSVGIGTATPVAGAILELSSTSKALVITRVANTAAVTSPVNGMLVYDISSTCIKSYENGAWTACLSLGTTTPAVAVNCATSAINGAYTTGTALTAGNTVTINMVNNSFSSVGPIAFSAADLVLSGTGAAGITVASASPASASIASGGSQTITYTLSGTPTTAGSFTATWTKLSLSCIKTGNTCLAISPFVVSSSTTPASLPIPVVAGNTINFTATGGTPNTSGITWTMSSSPAGLFSSPASGTGSSATAVLVANATGTVTVVFSATNACGVAATAGSSGVSVGDAIKGAIIAGGNATDLTNYNAALANTWVNVSAVSYNAIKSNLGGLSGVLPRLATDAIMATAPYAAIAGYTWTQATNVAQVPTLNYPVAIRVKAYGGGTMTGSKIKFSTTSLTSGYADYPAGTPNLPTTVVVASTEYYFVLKAPTVATSAATYVAMYNAGGGSVGRYFEPLWPAQGSRQTGGDVSNPSTADPGQFFLQLLTTPTKLW